MNNLIKTHEELTGLEETKWYLLNKIEVYEQELEMKKANILLKTSKEEWKKIGVTNENGRKAYITIQCEDLVNRLNELKNSLKYVEMLEKQFRRILNYHLLRIKDE